ncbi:hypothetical protein IFT37_20105 [Pseudomonas fluorescens]|uniref:hypothetical protein n=1 Tax=Pseudomonas fluorescens TaxID=294 RepID=UPI00177DEB3B|nr:hypothetical protein [Pseudomonas fluorescens]MBD8148256.1 hypothetical protein [Pseudomonas fluorescens]MBD8178137.1 hypothetical protein [Pseudomonas fluorescens]MBD8747412.1 hypothetical protein [Pseudomonas fluorescens]MBD8753476.1 hypothetical protein [Pseudomonas fluorescens]MBD8760907.1 hypothetical protein [Pseudomonas fluorescens]
MPKPAPPRLIVDQGETIVVLDTNAARNLAHELQCPPWALTFAKMKKEGYSFSLADGALMELLNQRARNSIKAQEIERLCQRLALFLNPQLPVILGKNDLLGMLQINTEPWSESSCRSLSAQTWQALESRHTHPVGDGPDALLQEARDEWIERLAHWQIVVDKLRSKNTKILEAAEELSPDELLQFLQSGPWATDFATATVDTVHDALTSSVENRNRWDVIEPQLRAAVFNSFESADDKTVHETQGMHLEIRYHWRQFARMQKKKGAYNPSSRSKRNDGIDYDLLSYLKLPALLVTEDGGFVDKLSDINSFQKDWIYRPQKLADLWEANGNPRPFF